VGGFLQQGRHKPAGGRFLKTGVARAPVQGNIPHPARSGQLEAEAFTELFSRIKANESRHLELNTSLITGVSV
jgi:hypothetical protein